MNMVDINRDIYNTDYRVRRIMDQLNEGKFGRPDIEFKDIYYNILYHNDPYFVLKILNHIWKLMN